MEELVTFFGRGFTKLIHSFQMVGYKVERWVLDFMIFSSFLFKNVIRILQDVFEKNEPNRKPSKYLCSSETLEYWKCNNQCHGWFKLELFMMVTRNLLNSEMTLELSPEILMLNVIQRMHLYHHNSFLDEMINLYWKPEEHYVDREVNGANLQSVFVSKLTRDQFGGEWNINVIKL